MFTNMSVPKKKLIVHNHAKNPILSLSTLREAKNVTPLTQLVHFMARWCIPMKIAFEHMFLILIFNSLKNA